MFYQSLLWKGKAYNAGIISHETFPLHLHHEIEMLYCVEGGMEIGKNGRTYTLKKGEFIIIGSMSAHEIVKADCNVCLLVELGPVFLREDFKQLSECNFYQEPYSLSGDEEYAVRLKKLFDEIYYEYNNYSDGSELIIQGNIYKICAYLIRDLPKEKQRANKSPKNIESIEKVLEMVYYHYNEQITIEDAARLCGYGKSNFCKIFKNTVGESFHAYLNDFRIKSSEYLLRETKMSVDEIAVASGFADAKSYCRAFKTNMGITPGQYRKKG